MKICLIKQLNNSFKIAFNSDYEKTKRLKVGEQYFFEVKKGRNLKFHRKFFALMNLVYDNQEHYTNLDHLRNDLTKAAGFYTERYSIDGEYIIEAKSISFTSMTEAEFNDLYSKTLDAIVRWFSFDRESMIQEIEQYF